MLLLIVAAANSRTVNRWCPGTNRAMVGNMASIEFRRGLRASDRSGHVDTDAFQHFQIYCTPTLEHRPGLLNTSSDSYDAQCGWSLVWPEEVKCNYVMDVVETSAKLNDLEADLKRWHCSSDNIMVSEMTMHCPFGADSLAAKDECATPIESCYVLFAVTSAYRNTQNTLLGAGAILMVVAIGLWFMLGHHFRGSGAASGSNGQVTQALNGYHVQFSPALPYQPQPQPQYISSPPVAYRPTLVPPPSHQQQPLPSYLHQQQYQQSSLPFPAVAQQHQRVYYQSAPPPHPPQQYQYQQQQQPLPQYRNYQPQQQQLQPQLHTRMQLPPPPPGSGGIVMDAHPPMGASKKQA